MNLCSNIDTFIYIHTHIHKTVFTEKDNADLLPEAKTILGHTEETFDMAVTRTEALAETTASAPAWAASWASPGNTHSVLTHVF